MITSLEGLRKEVSEDTVKLIITEYMMEAVARNEILAKLENRLDGMKDSEKLSVKEIKDMLDGFNEDEV